MIPGLGPAEVAKINGLALTTCASPTSYSELPQLRTLFDSTFQRGLERILKASARHQAGGARHIDVSLGWIDKMPLAESSAFAIPPKATARVELGDALVFAVDDLYLSSGVLARRTSRALLLQAKAARLVSQLSAPTVPLASVHGSTQKELTLLSVWPKFDLYAASNSKSPLVTNVDLSRLGGPLERFGWYLGAPGKFPPQPSPWTSWWMAGPPQLKAPVRHSLGELLVGFLSHSPVGGVSLGETYDHSGSDDWSKLCNALIALVSTYDAPVHLFGPNQKRLTTTKLTAAAFLLRSSKVSKTPGLTLGYHGQMLPWSTVSDFTRSKTIRDLLRKQIVHRGGAIHLGSTASPRRRPVITVTTTRIEEAPEY